MKTAQKIVNNLIMKMFGQLIKTRCVIFEDNQFMSKYSFHFNIKCFNIPVSIRLITLLLIC